MKSRKIIVTSATDPNPFRPQTPTRPRLFEYISLVCVICLSSTISHAEEILEEFNFGGVTQMIPWCFFIIFFT
jgi:hypothetical protein